MTPDRRFVLAALAAIPLAMTANPVRAGTLRTAVVATLMKKIRAEYQDAASGDRLAAALAGKLANGAYDTPESDEAFALRLTADLRAIIDDKHMAIMSGLPPGGADPSSDPVFQRKINYGVQDVRRLPGNVGLIELNFFPSPAFGRRLTGRYAAAMALVSETRALIVDIRAHNGGEPACVAYFASYFFDRPAFLLNEIVYRRKPRGRFFTTANPQGPRYGERRPVFIATSKDAFSGAEEFAYDLQTLKRATVVGEVTGGGANPNDGFDLGGGFTALIPDGRAVNPVTHTNWEGVGVKPDVAVAADKAVDVAHRLALQAALVAATADAEKASIRQALESLPPPA
jgi:hypothetical protein